MDVGSITKSRFKREKKTLKFIYYEPHGTEELAQGKKTQKTVKPKCFYSDIVDSSRKIQYSKNHMS